MATGLAYRNCMMDRTNTYIKQWMDFFCVLELTMEVEKKVCVQQCQLVSEIEFEIKTNGFTGKICMRSNDKNNNI